MPKQTKTCRVCGKEYEACRSIKTGDVAFNWREVACSPECGKIYLQRIMASRSTASVSCNSEKVDAVVSSRVSRRKKPINTIQAPDVSMDAINENAHSDVEGHSE